MTENSYPITRHIQRSSKYELAYGYDRAFGLFIQVFDLEKRGEEPRFEEDHITPERMCAVAEDYGFTIEPPEATIE